MNATETQSGSSLQRMDEDMGVRPPAGSIERKDNNGDYSPSNCIWATKTAQARNRRTNKPITIKGVTKPLAEWCEAYGVRYRLAYCRLAKGWSIESALLSPVGTKGKPHASALSVGSPLDT